MFITKQKQITTCKLPYVWKKLLSFSLVPQKIHESTLGQRHSEGIFLGRVSASSLLRCWMWWSDWSGPQWWSHWGCQIHLCCQSPFLLSHGGPEHPTNNFYKVCGRIEMEKYEKETARLFDLMDELQKWFVVLFPVLWQVYRWWVFVTAQFNGHLKAVSVDVVPILHPSWGKST